MLRRTPWPSSKYLRPLVVEFEAVVTAFFVIFLLEFQVALVVP